MSISIEVKKEIKSLGISKLKKLRADLNEEINDNGGWERTCNSNCDKCVIIKSCDFTVNEDEASEILLETIRKEISRRNNP